MDMSLRSLIQQLLPTCNRYVTLSDFISRHSRYSFGLYHHAFAAAIQEILDDYIEVVTQIEKIFLSGALTAQVGGRRDKEE
jgi:hypothetical protein